MKQTMIVDKLIRDQIEALLKFCNPRVFKTETDLIYEGHIPIAGYLILEGNAKLVKKKKVTKILDEGNLFGIHELLNNIPIKYGVQISSNSKLCILDKSTVKELIHRIELNEFPRIFEAFVF